MTTDLIPLAKKVERLTGPDREVDILIGYAVNLHCDDEHLAFRRSVDACGMEMMLRMAESYQSIWRTELPRYTASLDAAMTLTEGNFWTMDSWGVGPVWSAGIWSPRTNRWLVYSDKKRRSATPSLALTAASLRALSTSGQKP